MSKEELFNTIEQYLEGTLAAPALASFEEQLSADPELVREVALHRKLQAELGDATKRNLRNQLDQLKTEFTEADTPAKVVPLQSNWRRVLTVAAGIFMLGFLLWMFTQRSERPQEIVEDPDPPTHEEMPKERTPQNENPIVEEQPPIKEDLNEKPPIIAPIEQAPQLATNRLEPNPVFEAMIDQNGQQDNMQLDIERPQPNAKFTAASGNITLAFDGMVQTNLPEDKLGILVYLFDNQAKGATSGAAFQRMKLPLEKAEEEYNEDEGFAFAGADQYFFELKQTLKLAPGVYYYTLILANADQTLHTGKFTVNLPE